MRVGQASGVDGREGGVVLYSFDLERAYARRTAEHMSPSQAHHRDVKRLLCYA